MGLQETASRQLRPGFRLRKICPSSWQVPLTESWDQVWKTGKKCRLPLGRYGKLGLKVESVQVHLRSFGDVNSQLTRCGAGVVRLENNTSKSTLATAQMSQTCNLAKRLVWVQQHDKETTGRCWLCALTSATRPSPYTLHFARL